MPRVAAAIDGMLADALRDEQLLRGAPQAAGTLDDLIVGRVARLADQHWEELSLFEYQLALWLGTALSPADRRQVDRLRRLVARLRLVVADIRTLAAELKGVAIVSRIDTADVSCASADECSTVHRFPKA